MNEASPRSPQQVDESTRSHIPAADAPTADWRPGEETTNETLAENALGEQLDHYLTGLETGRRLGPCASPEVEELRPVVDQLHVLACYLGPAPPEAASSPAPAPGPDRPAAGLLPGRSVGKYEIVRQLGGGGQAAAHLAFDPDLRRHVVLKLFHEARSTVDQEAVLYEGRALARVRSRYVAQVYAADRDQGVPYLVVEYIPGRNLAEAQRLKPVSLDQSLEIVGHLAEGLAAVHACGLLHRDLKPSNIMLGDDGVPRLVDFGLAAHVGGDSLRKVSGTLAYMAPEQARGESERIDPRSDIFGLGAVLYMLLTGVPPHQAETREALWQAAKQGDIVPPRERNPVVPQAVNDLCVRCLAKDPSCRFASASELAMALKRLRTQRSWLAGLASQLRQRPMLGLAAAAALVLVIVPLAFLALHSIEQYRSDRTLASGRVPDTALVFDPAKGALAISSNNQGQGPWQIEKLHPDGRKLRQDFPVNVEIIGGQMDGQGVLQLVEDDLLSFRIQVSRDCYVTICHLDHLGNICTLFPYSKEPDNLITKDRPRVVPAEGKGRIRATVSEGPEHLYVLASTKPWKPPQGHLARTKEGDEFTAFTSAEERQAFKDVSRGVVLETPEASDDKSPAVTERIIHFHVRAAGK
jgi:serine/threonine protein kinase